MQAHRRRTPLQLRSQEPKPHHPSRRKSERLRRRNPLPARRPPIPKNHPPLRRSPSPPTKKFASAPTSSPSGASSSRYPATPPTIGSKPAASSSKKPASSLPSRAPRCAIGGSCAPPRDVFPTRLRRHYSPSSDGALDPPKRRRSPQPPANIPSPSRSAD